MIENLSIWVRPTVTEFMDMPEEEVECWLDNLKPSVDWTVHHLFSGAKETGGELSSVEATERAGTDAQRNAVEERLELERQLGLRK